MDKCTVNIQKKKSIKKNIHFKTQKILERVRTWAIKEAQLIARQEGWATTGGVTSILQAVFTTSYHISCGT